MQLYQVWPTTRLDRLAIWYLDKSPQAAPAVLEFYHIDHFENGIIAIGVSNLIKMKNLDSSQIFQSAELRLWCTATYM